jgi:DNA-binding NarL/FixJ family response regulator
MKKIRILLADDHRLVRSGLRLLIEQHSDLQVIGEATDGREAVSIAERMRPDVAVIDISMPRLNGIEVVRQIVSVDHSVATIIVTMHSDDSYILRALQAGAKGYLLKDSADADLISGIRAVAQGKSFFSPAVSKVLLEDYIRNLKHKGTDDSYDLLTPREREILQLIAEGRSNKEVASLLNLSVYTIETHRSNIMKKLHLRGVSDLTLYAVHKGIIQ